MQALPPGFVRDKSRTVASAPPMPKAPTGYRPGPTLQIDPGFAGGEAQLAQTRANISAGAEAGNIRLRHGLAVDEASRKADIESRKPPVGFRWNRAGQLEPIPGGPADPTASASKLTPELASDLKSRLTGISELEKRLGEMQRLYAKNFKGAPLKRGFGLLEMLPEAVNPSVQDFNEKGRRMGPIITGVLGLGSKGTDAATEYKQKVVPFIPQARSFDGTTEEKFRDLRSMIDSQRKLVSGQLGVRPQTQRKPQQVPPAAVEYLKANPATAARFDEKFGQGASARVLGGR